ncbi:hypothetical protein [Fervidobacterium thailandense]|uniref:Uncharacterized protein n=1 Tax=Fervidobacterium thailandense TaxID=1008305 RepID=A0A1E3G0G5_9BACT|nr:hypothetical protein [Fervidobacterium thailandense]ODN29712.1 hypothetical protein A4H02_09240 [Fervidobacterium thailandense]
MRARFFFFSALVCLLFLQSIFAHVPYFESHVISNISVSQVHYFEIQQPGVREIKIISRGEPLYLMFAVPRIERLKNYRPTFELIDPNGNVVEHFSTASIEPRLYHEEFGDTYEWIYYEKEFPTQPGTYVLKVTSNGPGKFWISVGRVEKFSIMDIIALPVTVARVRIFHEEFPILWWGWIILTLLGLGVWGIVSLVKGGG